MFVTKKYHTETVKMLERALDNRDLQINKLRKELDEARDFKSLIERLSEVKGITILSGYGCALSGTYDPLSQQEIMLKPDRNHSMTFVADELSENEVIIKEKSTKVVFLNKNGEVEKKGYTKQKADKGYTYKLIRE